MDSIINLYFKRAENEIILARTILDISIQPNLKKIHNIPEDRTFFNGVISHSYYAIFYSAKAYLISKGIKTSLPNEHEKTYLELKKFVQKGVLDEELLKIYDSEIIKADSLLNIFKTEKKKRGAFTYNVQSEANLPYAKESINNSRKFLSILKSILENNLNFKSNPK